MMQVFDDRCCALGEGPLWQPERQQLFWFDILGKQLMTQGQSWQFEEHVSAAGWIDHDTLLMASETCLFRFDLNSGARETVAPLETDNPITRSNDGRADPWGGFWIGTMGKNAEAGEGAIYRYYKGELRKLFDAITISNSICFDPDGIYACFADTTTQQIQSVALNDKNGWPSAEPRTYLNLRAEGLNPDGAVIDTQGRLWSAQWGSSRLACYKDATLCETIDVPARQVSCPAFGGADLTMLYATTAAHGAQDSQGGMTFCSAVDVPGQREHRVIV